LGLWIPPCNRVCGQDVTTSLSEGVEDLGILVASTMAEEICCLDVGAIGSIGAEEIHLSVYAGHGVLPLLLSHLAIGSNDAT
jgi:hypothetical protein